MRKMLKGVGVTVAVGMVKVRLAISVASWAAVAVAKTAAGVSVEVIGAAAAIPNRATGVRVGANTRGSIAVALSVAVPACCRVCGMAATGACVPLSQRMR